MRAMRIINTFSDLDSLERLYPICNHCLHIGNPLDEAVIRKVYGDDVSTADYMHKLICAKCGSKDVYLRIVSNVDMPHLGEHAIFSDNLRTL